MPAYAAGIVEGAVGATSVIQSMVSNVEVTAQDQAGFAVSASGKHAGGAIGVTVGGDVSNVSVNNLKQVSAVETAAFH